MRILYLTSSLPYGPVETFLIPEVKELLGQGHQLMLIPMFPRGPVIHKEIDDLIRSTKTQPLISSSILKCAFSEALNHPWECIKLLQQVFKSRNPKVLIKNLLVLPKGLWLARMARDWNADHIHVQWAAYTSTAGMAASKLTGIPWSITAHRWDIVENNLLEIKHADASFIRCISKSGIELWKKLSPKGFEKNNTILLHMGVDLSRFEFQAKRPQLRDTPVLFCPAGLLPVKGHKYLIEALALIHQNGGQARLWLAGKGPLQEELQAQADALGLGSHVKFLGYLTNIELMDLYRNSQIDVVVLPSVDLGKGLHEGIPVSLIEAMAHGLPVVSTTTGGIPELVDERSGILVPPKDPEALSSALTRLIENPKLRIEFGQRGKIRVQYDFNVKQTTNILGQLFMIFSRDALQQAMKFSTSVRQAEGEEVSERLSL